MKRRGKGNRGLNPSKSERRGHIIERKRIKRDLEKIKKERNKKSSQREAQHTKEKHREGNKKI